MIFTRETNPAASYRTDGSPAHEWDYRDLRDQLDRRKVALGQAAPIPQFPDRAARAGVLVYVNHSRWLWACPTCKAIHMAANTGRGFCTNCWNAGDGWYPLFFPAERLDLERILDARPDPASRNWQPGETLRELELENRAYGVAA